MNIVCTICSDLLIPSSDVYSTPCGHIFHFQCITKWLQRSKSCPQCRVRTTERSIYRIYFNFSNDDSIYQIDSAKLQDEINSLSFKLTLAKKEISELKISNNKLELTVVPLKQTIQKDEEIIKKHKSAILALKEQIQYYKALCEEVAKKDNEIKMLNIKLEKLKSIQVIMESSAQEVDMIITSYSDISKLQTFVSVLKRELENSIIQKRQLREKVSAKSKAAAELVQVRSKLRKLEEMLKNQNEEKESLQAELLQMRTAEYNSKSDKITAVKKKSQNDYKKYNSKVVSIETKYKSNANNNETSESEKDKDCIIVGMLQNDTENTPQNIKLRDFFSVTNRGIKRTGSIVTVPPILAKKPMNSTSLNKMDQVVTNWKKTIGNGMTFDGFGGHAKYDKFPKST